MASITSFTSWWLLQWLFIKVSCTCSNTDTGRVLMTQLWFVSMPALYSCFIYSVLFDRSSFQLSRWLLGSWSSPAFHYGHSWSAPVILGYVTLSLGLCSGISSLNVNHSETECVSKPASLAEQQTVGDYCSFLSLKLNWLINIFGQRVKQNLLSYEI